MDDGTRGPVRGVVIAHGGLAHALVRAVESISGITGALSPISNEGASPDELRRRVEQAAGTGPVVLFVDLTSGSCAFCGRVVARQSTAVAVVTGVNLPMLLDFVFHREADLGSLVERLVRKGRLAVEAPAVRPEAAR